MDEPSETNPNSPPADAAEGPKAGARELEEDLHDRIAQARASLASELGAVAKRVEDEEERARGELEARLTEVAERCLATTSAELARVAAASAEDLRQQLVRQAATGQEGFLAEMRERTTPHAETPVETGQMQETLRGHIADAESRFEREVASLERRVDREIDSLERRLARAEAEGQRRDVDQRIDAALSAVTQALASMVASERNAAGAEERIAAVEARANEISNALGRTTEWDERLRRASRDEEKAAARIFEAERRLRQLIDGD